MGGGGDIGKAPVALEQLPLVAAGRCHDAQELFSTRNNEEHRVAHGPRRARFRLCASNVAMMQGWAAVGSAAVDEDKVCDCFVRKKNVHSLVKSFARNIVSALSLQGPSIASLRKFSVTAITW